MRANTRDVLQGIANLFSLDQVPFQRVNEIVIIFIEELVLETESKIEVIVQILMQGSGVALEDPVRHISNHQNARSSGLRLGG